MINEFSVVFRASMAIMFLTLAAFVSGIILGVMDVSGPFERVTALITNVRLLVILLFGAGIVWWAMNHNQFSNR